MMRVVRGAGISSPRRFAAVALYVGCALLLRCDPRNTGFVESENGIPVYVRTNGIARRPRRPDAVRRSRLGFDFPAAHVRALPAATNWIAFGWGDRGFAVETPTWSDLRPGTAIIALSGVGSGDT
jgi:hypothetical protein